jgi:hypothetical protein
MRMRHEPNENPRTMATKRERCSDCCASLESDGGGTAVPMDGETMDEWYKKRADEAERQPRLQATLDQLADFLSGHIDGYAVDPLTGEMPVRLSTSDNVVELRSLTGQRILFTVYPARNVIAVEPPVRCENGSVVSSIYDLTVAPDGWHLTFKRDEGRVPEPRGILIALFYAGLEKMLFSV